MGMLNTARIIMNNSLVGSVEIPAFIAIGSGSGAFSNSQTGLAFELTGYRRVFTTTDSSTSMQKTWTGDWGASTLSGLQVSEFGITTGSGGGTVWSRDTMIPVTFDSTNELQIQITFQTF